MYFVLALTSFEGAKVLLTDFFLLYHFVFRVYDFNNKNSNMRDLHTLKTFWIRWLLNCFFHTWTKSWTSSRVKKVNQYLLMQGFCCFRYVREQMNSVLYASLRGIFLNITIFMKHAWYYERSFFFHVQNVATLLAINSIIIALLLTLDARLADLFMFSFHWFTENHIVLFNIIHKTIRIFY